MLGISLDMDINRGDRMDYIVSMDGNSRGAWRKHCDCNIMAC